MYLFFLRVNEREIARIEIPAWIAGDPRLVASVHASALADARATGYPYTLAQAHQQVVVTGDVALPLRQAAEAIYLQETGRQLRSSAKTAFKKS